MKIDMFLSSRYCKETLRIITMIAYVAARILISQAHIRRISRRCGIPTWGLAPPVDSGTALKDYEFVFEDQWRTRTQSDPTLFSPVYDGRVNSAEDPFPYVEDQHLHILLEMMRDVINIWVQRDVSQKPQHTDNTIVLQSLQAGLLNLPSAHDPGFPHTNDFIYESCRLTSVLMVRSVQTLSNWRLTAERESLLRPIREALKRTDLGGLWGNKVGLLYWVVLVFSCAAFGTPDYLKAHSVLLMLHFELTFTKTDWHGALLPMVALKDVILLADT